VIRPSVLRPLALAAIVAAAGVNGLVARADLPARLSSEEFWQLSTSLSEPDGWFRSDNLLSNETGMQAVIPELVEGLPAGGVYLGVGPEQNFSYIAALKPRIAFIVDIRRGNRDLHLMYKALFEMAADRAEFVSLLFSKRRPEGLTAASSVDEIFQAYAGVRPDGASYRRTSARIGERLLRWHALRLSDDERAGVQYVFDNFFQFGPAIGYSSSSTGRRGVGPTYELLMRGTDRAGQQRSYLATEDNFQVVKDLHARNLVVPVVGNFAGPSALRAVGAWLKERGAVVSAFYLSNVESYLRRDGLAMDFCRNVAALPLDQRSRFIRSGPSALVALPRAVVPPAPVSPVPLGSQAPRPVLEFRLDGPILIVPGQLRIPSGGPGNTLGLMADEIKVCSLPAGGV
jgi:hypothetical protein